MATDSIAAHACSFRSVRGCPLVSDRTWDTQFLWVDYDDKHQPSNSASSQADHELKMAKIPATFARLFMSQFRTILTDVTIL
jgi:hypothetical protein